MRFTLARLSHQSFKVVACSTRADLGRDSAVPKTVARRFRRKVRWTVTIAIVMAALFEIPAQASDRTPQMHHDNPRTLVIILSSLQNAHRTGKLTDTLIAHLNTLPVTLETVHRAGLEAYKSASARASMVLWLDNDGDTLNILIPELGKTPRQMNIDGTKAGSQAWFDALAVIVYSEVSGIIPIPYFEPEDRSVETAPKKPAPTSDTAKTTAQPSNRIEVAIHPASPKRESKKNAVWLGFQAGYSPSWPIVNQSVQHGTRLAATLLFLKYLAADISFEVLPAYKNNAGDNQVQLKRWPLRLMIRGHLPIRSFFVSAGVGLLVDMLRIDGLDGKLQQGDADRVQAVLGTTLMLSTGYWLKEWLGVIAQGGIDVASKSVRYTIQDRVTMSLRVVRPAVQLGVALRWSIVEGH